MKRSALTVASLGVLFSIGTALGAAGCATRSSHPPKELIEARAAYHRTSTEPGAMRVPEDVADAHKALEAAEKSFKDSGDSPRTESLAYVAQRRALAVRAKGDAMESLEAKKVALAELDRMTQQHSLATRERLEREKGRIAEAQQEAAEKKARVSAQAKVQEELCQVEGVKAEESRRGLVLTLSDAELFTGNKAQLSAQGKARLGKLANVLKSDDRTLLVLGYTDARGSDKTNERVSMERADAVRKYLSSHGVDEARLRAEGLGKREPIASNDTAPGRAANRRVEIVVENAPGIGEGEAPER